MQVENPETEDVLAKTLEFFALRQQYDKNYSSYQLTLKVLSISAFSDYPDKHSSEPNPGKTKQALPNIDLGNKQMNIHYYSWKPHRTYSKS
tara:strand:+ start:604 stop:876 length:273 start_codon:yes stop_codon:yes gene_type:complete